MRIAIVGVGLIGGSIGLAARERLGAEVAGFDPAAGVLEAALARRRHRPRGAGSARGRWTAPRRPSSPRRSARCRRRRRRCSPPRAEDCVVTDVGSTKRAIVAAVDDERFIGGHPLAGAETAGVEHARADLFDGATWYLTPTPGDARDALRAAAPAARRASARARRRSTPTTHDRLLADRLPPARTCSPTCSSPRPRARSARTSSCRRPARASATRRASRAPTRAIWRDIYLANADALIAGDRRRGRAAGRGPRGAGGRRRRRDRRLERAARARTAGACSRPTSPAARCTSCASSVPNRPGVVAEVALALGRGGVNIADMALYPAPDRSLAASIALWIAGAEHAAAGRGARGRARAARWRARERRSSARRRGLRGHARAAGRQVDLAPRRAARRR